MERLKSVFSIKPLWKKIIKCTVAYEAANVIILIPQVYQTVTVAYLMPIGALLFNPSSNSGAQVLEMLLYLMFQVSAAIFSAIIVYLCTLYNRNIESASLYSNGVGIIAAIAFFFATIVIAYYRLKFPRLFIPSLQGFVVTFFCLTANGIYSTQFNIMSIVGIFYPTLGGGVIALLVNLLLWPETAAKTSEQVYSFSNALSSIQNVLECVESQVLKECDDMVFSDLSASKKLRQTIQTLDGDISKMQSSRKEAQYEIVVSHYCPMWYKSLAKTLEGLSQNLYGFSLAVEREGQVILCQKVDEQLSLQRNSNASKEEEQSLRLRKQQIEKNRETPINKGDDLMAVLTSTRIAAGDIKVSRRIEYKLISRLQSSVQPEIKKFIQICTKVILYIRHRLEDNGAISKEETGMHTCPNHTHRLDLQEAMESLKEAKIILQKEYEARRAVPTEDHFLIYTILFSLTQFGNKLAELEQEADQLIARKTTGRYPRVFFPRVASFRKWLGKASESVKGARNPAEQVLFNQQNSLQREEIRSENNSVSPASSTTAGPGYENEEQGRNSSSTKSAMYGANDAIEKRSSEDSDWTNDQQTTPLQNTPGSHIWNRWLHSFSEWFLTDPVRYAIKFAVTMELLALMAWLPIPGVNALYNNNHGQWALLSAMIVFNFTVGSTAWQCFYRVFATITGAVAGYICLLAANRNERPYAMAIMILVFQVPMWYVLLGSKYPRVGFISLLTMAVITSTGYNDRYAEDLFAPVWKRTITAVFAIIAVLIIDQILWPVWARKIIRKYLSNLLIATGIQFSKVASLVCQENTQSHRYQSTLLDAQYNTKILKRQNELTCQMLALAGMEPRITKGAFPIQVYRDILEHEQHILYWIEHLLVSQSFITVDVRKKIMFPMNAYRKELAAAVHLYLFTLACSIRTKSSLPASLPSAEIARKMLQQRQAKLWHEHFDEFCEENMDEGNADVADDNSKSAEERKEQRSAENQIYWQTYAAGSVEVIVEQEAMGELVTKLMGQHVFKAATKDWII